MKSLSARTRFILLRGVVPWGMLVGLAATAFVVHDTVRPVLNSAGQGPVGLAALALLCFIEWSLGAGWIIGAVRWTISAGPKASRQSQVGDRNGTTGEGPAR